jgi:hypothetical protein
MAGENTWTLIRIEREGTYVLRDGPKIQQLTPSSINDAISTRNNRRILA